MKDINLINWSISIMLAGLILLITFSEPKTVEVEPSICIEVEEEVLGKAEDHFEGVRNVR